MAHYYITDAFSTWSVLDPARPDELPAVRERIWCAIVDGPTNKEATKAYTEVYTLEYLGLEWLKQWYEMLRKSYDENAVVIWIRIPPIPKLPEKWKMCATTVCEHHLCEYYDDGFCLDGPEGCKHGETRLEFSAGG